MQAAVSQARRGRKSEWPRLQLRSCLWIFEGKKPLHKMAATRCNEISFSITIGWWVATTFSSVGGWPRLFQFHRSVGVRDFLAFQIGGCPRLSRQLSHSLAARTRQWDKRSFRDLSRRSRRVSSRMVCLAWYRADHDYDARVLDVLREKDEDRAAWIRRGGARSTSGSVHGNPIG